jgi:hypothetical protein
LVRRVEGSVSHTRYQHGQSGIRVHSRDFPFGFMI